MLRKLVVVAALAALLVPAAAAAKPPASAQRFADAAKRTKIALSQAREQFTHSFRAVEYDRCLAIVLAEKGPPKRVAADVETFTSAALSSALILPTIPHLERFVADLDAIGTNDRALRAGREAWRQALGAYRQFPRLDRPCRQLEAWKRSGWKTPPAIDLQAFERLVDDSTYATAERDLARAVKRLRKLGVSERDAERFSGDTLLDGAIDDKVLEEAFGLDDETFEPTSEHRVVPGRD